MTDQQIECHAVFEELIEELKAVAQWSCCLELKELEQRVDADHVWSNPVVEEFRLFHTPQDWDEIMEWIHLHPVEDRAHIVTAACMAWNLAARRLATTMRN